MSSNATNPTDTRNSASESGVDNTTQINVSPSSKGKAKAKDVKDHDMEEEEEEEDDEEEMGSEEEVSDGEVEEDFEEIDPSVIITQGRRTRGVKVDYTSKEALAKAGLQANEDEESDDDVEMKD